MTVTKQQVREVLDVYIRAWEDQDPELICTGNPPHRPAQPASTPRADRHVVLTVFGHAKEKGPDCRQQRRDLAGIGVRQSAHVSVDSNGACRGGSGGAAGRGASQ
jgi:hypothetical protein